MNDEEEVSLMTHEQLTQIQESTKANFDNNDNGESIRSTLEALLHDYMNLFLEYNSETFWELTTELFDAIMQGIQNSEAIQAEVASITAGIDEDEGEDAEQEFFNNEHTQFIGEVVEPFIDRFLSEQRAIRNADASRKKLRHSMRS